MGACIGLFQCDTSANLDPHFDKSFYKLYGVQGDQIGKDVKQTPDGGYVIIGSSDESGFQEGLGTDQQNIFLVRTDNLGNEIYHRTFGGPYKDEGVAIEVDPSGNFVFVANSKNANGFWDAIIYKVADDEFASPDSVIYGKPDEDNVIYGLSVISTGYIICGYTTEIDSTGKSAAPVVADITDIYSVKMDANLVEDPLWDKIVGFDGEDYGIKILEQPSGSFVFFSYTNRDAPTNNNPSVDGFKYLAFRTNIYGVPLGNEVFDGTLNDDIANGVTVSSNNAYGIIGTTSSGSDNRIWISRLRTVNDAISRIEGYSISVGSLEGISIIENTDQNYYILGNKIVSSADKDIDIYLAQITKSGVLLWDRTFGGEELDEAGSVIQSSNDGGVVLTGSVELQNQFKIVLIKTGSNGDMSF